MKYVITLGHIVSSGHFDQCKTIIVTLEDRKPLYSHEGRILLGCKYNSKIYPIDPSPLKNGKQIYTRLEKYKMDKIIFVKRITALRGMDIVFSAIPRNNTNTVGDDIDSEDD